MEVKEGLNLPVPFNSRLSVRWLCSLQSFSVVNTAIFYKLRNIVVFPFLSLSTQLEMLPIYSCLISVSLCACPFNCFSFKANAALSHAYVVLTFDSVDEILKCEHSNESY